MDIFNHQLHWKVLQKATNKRHWVHLKCLIVHCDFTCFWITFFALILFEMGNRWYSFIKSIWESIAIFWTFTLWTPHKADPSITRKETIFPGREEGIFQSTKMFILFSFSYRKTKELENPCLLFLKCWVFKQPYYHSSLMGRNYLLYSYSLLFMKLDGLDIILYLTLVNQGN
jgi:hypothetical protein